MSMPSGEVTSPRKGITAEDGEASDDRALSALSSYKNSSTESGPGISFFTSEGTASGPQTR